MRIPSICKTYGNSATETGESGSGLGALGVSALGQSCVHSIDDNLYYHDLNNRGIESCKNKQQKGWTFADFRQKKSTGVCGAFAQSNFTWLGI